MKFQSHDSFEMERVIPYRDFKAWVALFKEAKIFDKLSQFELTNVTTGKDLPPSEVPRICEDVMLDGQKVDIYKPRNHGQVYLRFK